MEEKSEGLGNSGIDSFSSSIPSDAYILDMEVVDMNSFMLRIFAAAAFATALAATPAAGQKEYGSGVTDTEIKIGNISPYTGLFRSMGRKRAPRSYFQMINDRGG